MYIFLTYEAEYFLRDIIHQQEDEKSSFTSIQRVRASYNALNGLYDFLFDDRKNITIDGSVPTNTMDVFMAKIGNAVFPITLICDKYGNILRVKEYELYKLRWKKTVDSILNDYDNSVFLINYVNISRKNIETSNNLILALQRNSFIKHILMSDSIGEYTLIGFPESTDKDMLDINLTSTNNDSSFTFELSSRSTVGNIVMTKNQFGMIEKSLVYLKSLENEDMCYTRHISIEVISGSQKIERKSWLTF